MWNIAADSTKRSRDRPLKGIILELTLRNWRVQIGPGNQPPVSRPPGNGGGFAELLVTHFYASLLQDIVLPFTLISLKLLFSDALFGTQEREQALPGKQNRLGICAFRGQALLLFCCWVFVTQIISEVITGTLYSVLISCVELKISFGEAGKWKQEHIFTTPIES